MGLKTLTKQERRVRRVTSVLAGNAIVVCGALCMTFYSISVAWFANNKEVKETGMNVAVFDPEIVDSVSFHEFKSVPNTDVNYSTLKNALTFNPTGSADQDLGYYNIVGGKDYQLLVEVNLTDYGKSLDTLILRAVTSAQHYLAELNSEGKPYSLLAANNNPLSSIIQFALIGEDEIEEVSASSVIKVNVSDSVLDSRYTSFVNSSSVLVPQINVKDTANITTSGDKFYILMNYNRDQIEEIYSANLGNEVVSGGSAEGMTEHGNEYYISYKTDFYFNLLTEAN